MHLRFFMAYDETESKFVFWGNDMRGRAVISEQIPMSHMKAGESGRVTELMLQGEMRRRLQDLGLIPGTIVECVGRSPLGDPAAYLIRGAVIALRNSDSGQIMIRRQGVCYGSESGS